MSASALLVEEQTTRNQCIILANVPMLLDTVQKDAQSRVEPVF